MNSLRLRKIISISVIVIGLGFLIYSALFVSYVVDGKSMNPTFDDGNMLKVNRVAYNLKEINRFDIVVFHANKEEDYVKRVIGLPGDTIEYKNDRLYINNKYVEEPFLHYLRQGKRVPYTEDFKIKDVTEKTKVPKNKLFLMGDNRPESLDSRSFGFIEMDQIVGKVDRVDK